MTHETNQVRRVVCLHCGWKGRPVETVPRALNEWGPRCPKCSSSKITILEPGQYAIAAPDNGRGRE